MISLFKHNEEAYHAALDMLASYGRACIIHPTGTGKSFIGFKLCEEHPDKTVCWLSPSEYIFQTQSENLKQAANGYMPTNIKFYTYAKLMFLSEEEVEEIKPDYFVLDEFHRCGSQVWGGNVMKLLTRYHDVPVLGLSATNIRYLDNYRDMAEELFDGHVASSMSLGEAIVRGILNPPKYVLSIYSYREELDRLELRVKHTKNRAAGEEAERYLQALRRTLEKAEGIEEVFAKHMENPTGKYIVFCADYEHMQEVIRDQIRSWVSKIDKDPKIYTLYSGDPDTSASFQAFREDRDETHLRLLFTIDALNEGVHVEDISGVILLRPTVSPIVYKQQIGRALSASGQSMPVIFDIVNNIENLYSIDSVREEMQEAVQYFKGIGENEEIVHEHFTIIDQVAECRMLFAKLEESLSCGWEFMWEQARAYYEQHGDLEIPKEEAQKDRELSSLRSWIITQRRVYTGKSRGILTQMQVMKLNAIGMRWDPKEEANWKKNMEACKTYRAEHGDLLVPAGYQIDGVMLGSFIATMRAKKRADERTGFLASDAHFEELERVGMIWDVQEYQFRKAYEALARYYKEYGDADVPADYTEPETGIKLGAWCGRIRREQERLSEEQREMLQAVEFPFETVSQRQWEKNYAALQKYLKKLKTQINSGQKKASDGEETENGAKMELPVERGYSQKEEFTEKQESLVKQGSPVNQVWSVYDIPVDAEFDGIKIGAWLRTQQNKYRMGKLSKEQVQNLTALGITFKQENAWEEKYHLLQKYYEEHGNLQIPANYIVEGVWLHRWLNRQIHAGETGAKHPLSAEQREKLEALGVEFNRAGNSEKLWKQHLTECENYYRRHGNLKVTKKENPELYNWLQMQKTAYWKGTLSEEKSEVLRKYGVTFKSHGQTAFETGYAYAKEYYETHGNLEVKRDYVTTDGYKLGVFIANSRTKYKNGKMAEEEAGKMEDIGMIWDLAEYRWNYSFQQAYTYYRKNRKVPQKYKINMTEEEYRIYEWIRGQVRNPENLSEQRSEKLETIGVVIKK